MPSPSELARFLAATVRLNLTPGPDRLFVLGDDRQRRRRPCRQPRRRLAPKPHSGCLNARAGRSLLVRRLSGSVFLGLGLRLALLDRRP